MSVKRNFDRIRFEYFGDRKVAFEAFKAGVFTFREEFTSAVWATGYDFAAVKDGRIIRATLPDESPMGTQGWFLNIQARQVQGCQDQTSHRSCLRFRMDQRQHHVWRLCAHHVVTSRTLRWRRKAARRPKSLPCSNPIAANSIQPCSAKSMSRRCRMVPARIASFCAGRRSFSAEAGCKRSGTQLDLARRQALRNRVSGFRQRLGAAYRALHQESEAARHRGALPGRRCGAI